MRAPILFERVRLLVHFIMSLPFSLLFQIFKLEAVFVGPGVIPADKSHGLDLMLQLVSDEDESFLEQGLVLFHDARYLSDRQLDPWEPRLSGVLQKCPLGREVVV